MRSKKFTQEELKVFSDNVDLHRKRAGLTWTQLGASVGISRPQINHVRNAENSVSLRVYKKLCEVLKTAQPPLL